MAIDPKDADALAVHKAKIGRELATLSPELLRLIERAADWSGSRLYAELREIPSGLGRLKAAAEADRVRDMARLTLGECATHWMPDQLRAKRAARRANAAKAEGR